MHKEKLLIKKILNGDRKGFNQLVEDYKRLVVHIVYANIKCQNDRDDLCQEIFLKVYQKLSTFKYQSKLSTWIGKIAYNSCLNHIYKTRDKKCKDTGDDTEDIFQSMESLSEKEPDLSLMQKEIAGIMEQKIQELPMKYKTVLIMYHLDQLSYKEISDILGMTLDNIKVILFRARAMLKTKLLQDYKKEDIWM